MPINNTNTTRNVTWGQASNYEDFTLENYVVTLKNSSGDIVDGPTPLPPDTQSMLYDELQTGNYSFNLTVISSCGDVATRIHEFQVLEPVTESTESTSEPTSEKSKFIIMSLIQCIPTYSQVKLVTCACHGSLSRQQYLAYSINIIYSVCGLLVYNIQYYNIQYYYIQYTVLYTVYSTIYSIQYYIYHTVLYTAYSTIYSIQYYIQYTVLYSIQYYTVYSTIYSIQYYTVYSTIYSIQYNTVYSTIQYTILYTLYSTIIQYTCNCSCTC